LSSHSNNSISKSAKGTVLIAGGSGFIGNEVGAHLVRQGWLVRVLMRRPSPMAFPAEIHYWNGDGTVPDAAMTGVDAVVNLSGESIATGRWTSERKAAILNSRLQTTRAIVASIQRHRTPAFVQTSAVGIYGDTGDRTTTEETPTDQLIPAETSAGGKFLVEVCRQWEAAASQIDPSVTRLVILRTGVVLGSTGGALPEMLLPYEMGVGAVVGGGDQYISWIHISDYCQLISTALQSPRSATDSALAGTYNAVTPGAVSIKTLHLVLNKYFPGLPWGFSNVAVPGWILRVGLGEKSTIVLDGQRVMPRRLMQFGFTFKFPAIEEALEDLLPAPNGPFAGCAVLVRRQWVPADIGRVWNFFSRAENLERMTPSFLAFRIVAKTTPAIEAGTEISYRLRLHGVPIGWTSRITTFDPQQRFVDTQVRGPYAIWHHEHSFEALGSGQKRDGTLISDVVHFKLPIGRPGRLVGQWFARRDIGAIFDFRAKTVAGMIESESISR